MMLGSVHMLDALSIYGIFNVGWVCGDGTPSDAEENPQLKDMVINTSLKGCILRVMSLKLQHH